MWDMLSAPISAVLIPSWVLVIAGLILLSGGAMLMARVKVPDDETIWHKCRSPFFPRRTIDGKWTDWNGQTWRRRISGRWQYRQDAETVEEFLGRQW